MEHGYDPRYEDVALQIIIADANGSRRRYVRDDDGKWYRWTETRGGVVSPEELVAEFAGLVFRKRKPWPGTEYSGRSILNHVVERSEDQAG